MALNTVLAAGIVMNVLAVIFAICAVVLVLVVLIQKGRGGGLSSAFAGGMASGILGSKTGDFLTWVTIGVVSVFLFGALILNKWWRPTVSGPGPQGPAPVTSTDTGNESPVAPGPVSQPEANQQ